MVIPMETAWETAFTIFWAMVTAMQTITPAVSSLYGFIKYDVSRMIFDKSFVE